MRLIDNHYVLENLDIVNNIGYDLVSRSVAIDSAVKQKKADRLLKQLSTLVYGLIEKRVEKEYLVQKFNEDTNFVLDTLLLQFEYHEENATDIFMGANTGVSPLVQDKLRNAGLLFEGVILR